MERPSRALTLVLFAAGFLSMARGFASGHYGAGYEILNVARTLAETGTFGNPYGSLPTGPTAHCAPLYPMFLALLIKLLGYSVLFVLAANTCALIMYGLHAALLPRVSVLFFGTTTPGIWAAGMQIVLPVFFFLPQFNTIYDAVGVMLFCLASTAFGRAPGRWRALGLGIFLGMLALLNPSDVTVCGLWLLYLAWRQPAAQIWRWTGWAAASALLVVTPWTVRNYLQFHQFVPIRDNLGVELYNDNNDLAEANYAENFASFMKYHPAASIDEAREIIRMGEAAYSESRRARAVAWIRSHPRRFFQLACDRARMYWFSDEHDYWIHAWSLRFVTLLSFAGLALVAFRREAIGVYIGTVWMIYPLIYYCVNHDHRYREPAIWLTLLPAGYVVWAASAKLRKLWQFRM
jgi:hypothetical protein